MARFRGISIATRGVAQCRPSMHSFLGPALRHMRRAQGQLACGEVAMHELRPSNFGVTSPSSICGGREGDRRGLRHIAYQGGLEDVDVYARCRSDVWLSNARGWGRLIAPIALLRSRSRKRTHVHIHMTHAHIT